MKRRIEHLPRLAGTESGAGNRGSCVGAFTGVALLAFSGQFLLSGQSLAADEVHGQPINVSSNASPVKPPSGQNAPTNAVDSAKAGISNSAGFDKLAGFHFWVTDAMVSGSDDSMSTSLNIASQIPESVKALNEKTVSIAGFMLPVTVRDGKTSDFLLLKNQSACCYGITPAMNEFVTVRMAGRGVKPVMDRPVVVTGTLHVGEIRQQRILVGIYRLDGDKVEMPGEP